MCVLFCFVTRSLGNRYGPGGFPRVDRPQRTWGARILTLLLNYVPDYTGFLLFLFERTQQLTQALAGYVLNAHHPCAILNSWEGSG